MAQEQLQLSGVRLAGGRNYAKVLYVHIGIQGVGFSGREKIILAGKGRDAHSGI